MSESMEVDGQVAALELALNMPSKAFILPEKREIGKVKKISRNKGYELSAEPNKIIDKKITFQKGEANFTSNTRKRINVLSKVYKVHSGVIKKIVISVHTGVEGRSDFNLKLSQSRADSIKRELISYGVPANIILAKGYGESRLLQNIPKISKDNERVELNLVLL